MKLTKKQTGQIQDAIDALDRGIKLILSPDTIIGRRTSSSNSTVWKDERGLSHYSMTKDIGSDLCGIYTAREILQRMITPIEKENL